MNRRYPNGFRICTKRHYFLPGEEEVEVDIEVSEAIDIDKFSLKLKNRFLLCTQP